MPDRSLYGRVAELDAGGGTFAVATVVAVQRPTSARPGARGIIHPDGTIEGWVGGSCAQPVVVREALRSLGDGQPRLLRLSKDVPAEGRRGDGVVELVMTCHSGGTLEIYVEPHRPAPSLWVAGTTPIVAALVALGSATGWRVSVFDPVADQDAFPGAERVSNETAIGRIDPELSPYVIVATQGIWDEEALASAFRRSAVSYVGLVASPTRANVVRAWLRDEAHVPDERLAALRAPAGIDLGAETPGEIALSILAELVQVRRGRAAFVAMPGPATIAGEAGRALLAVPSLAAAVDDIVLLDPVCGMTVDRAHARHLAEHEGVVYAFCRMGCRTAFLQEPGAYVPGPYAAGAGAQGAAAAAGAAGVGAAAGADAAGVGVAAGADAAGVGVAAGADAAGVGVAAGAGAAGVGVAAGAGAAGVGAAAASEPASAPVSEPSTAAGS